MDKNLVKQSSEITRKGRAYWNRQIESVGDSFYFRQLSGESQGEFSEIARELSSEAQGTIQKIAGKNPGNAEVLVFAALNFLLASYVRGGSIIVKTAVRGDLGESLGVKSRPIIQSINSSLTVKELIFQLQKTISLSNKYYEGLAENGWETLTNVGFFNYSLDKQQLSSAGLDCLVLFDQNDAGYRLVCKFQTSCFETAFIDQFMIHLDRVLTQFNSGDRLLPEINYLTEGECKWLKQDLQVLTPIQDESIVKRFEKWAEKQSGELAIYAGEKKLTYGRLNQLANQFARYLRDELDVQPGDRVALMLKKSWYWPSAILAILKAGASYVPVDIGFPKARIRHILQDMDPSALIIDSSQMFEVGDYELPVFVADLQLEELEEEDHNLDLNISEKSPAYHIFTSGSSGKPKGVTIGHESVLNLTSWQHRVFDVKPKDQILQFFSYSFDGAVGETFMALLNGATLNQFDTEDLNARKLEAFLNERGINVAVLVPSVLKQLNVDQLSDPTNLKLISVGEECPPDLALKWRNHGVEFFNAYGPTEYSVYSHLHKVDAKSSSLNQRVPIGQVLDNSTDFILDQFMNPVPPGVVGEICLSGKGLAKGYWNDNIKTLSRFVPNKSYLKPLYQDKGEVQVESATAELELFLENPPSFKSAQPLNEILGTPDKQVVEKLVKDLDDDLKTFAMDFLNKYEIDSPEGSSFYRYCWEGSLRTYASRGINPDLLKELLGIDSFDGLRLVDLGFGNGEILETLQNTGLKAKGFDLSPFFVQNGRSRGLDVDAAKLDEDSDLFSARLEAYEQHFDLAISTLLLDRVSHPMNYLKNLFFLLKSGGKFAIQTLLPVVAKDDGNVNNPLVYTDNAQQITLGKASYEDMLSLVKVLNRLGVSDIKVARFPMAVASRDGVQEYTVWSFSGTKSNQEIVDHSFDTLYRTGDLGRYLSNGEIEFLGREDAQVKVRGFRIEFGEIEHHLLSHELVSDVCVSVFRDDQDVPRLVAYIVSLGDLTMADLKNHAAKVLPEYMIPGQWIFMDVLPQTISGKVDRKALPDPQAYLQKPEEELAVAENSLQKQLVKIWQEILGVQSLGIDDNFFDRGGHSLKATQVISRISEQFGKELRVNELFKNPTVRQMSDLIESSAIGDVAKISKVEVATSYDLSYTQQSQWLLQQSASNQYAFNMPSAYFLDGDFQLEAWQKALKNVVERHESLRTHFITVAGVIKQEISPTFNLSDYLEYCDFTNKNDPETEFRNLIEAEVFHNFDLSKGPLLRLKLVKLDQNRHGAILNMHHIISDGTSFLVLLDELSTFYNAEVMGNELTLAPLDIQYKDYAAWHNNKVMSTKFAGHKAHWAKRFDGDVPDLELITDRPRPEVKTNNGDVTSLSISATLTRELQTLTTHCNGTLFVGLMAIYKLLLFKCTGQSDITVGTSVEGRQHKQLERQIGLFLNTIAFRNHIDDDDTFEVYLRRMAQEVREDYEYQDYPFGALIEDLNIRWNPARTPLFDVFILLQNNELAQPGSETFSGLEVTTLNRHFPISKFDLTFSFKILEDGQLRLNMEYNSDLFDRSTIEKMGKEFVQLLEKAVQNPEKPLHDADWLAMANDSDFGAFLEV